MVLLLSVLLFLAELVFWAGVGRAGFVFARTRNFPAPLVWEALLIATLATSAADSVNPFAITQQFVLQGMVKKPWYIWFFILPTGIVNWIGAFLAYYGLIEQLAGVVTAVTARFAPLLRVAGILAGVFLLGLSLVLVRKMRGQKEDAEPDSDREKEVRSVHPVALIFLGGGATLMELTTALPYFGFLAVLFTFRLTFFQVIGILTLYNLVYMLPLMMLYGVYRFRAAQFTRLYAVFRKWAGRFSGWVSVLFSAVAGLGLLWLAIFR